jgi:hypothetical protein
VPFFRRLLNGPAFLPIRTKSVVTVVGMIFSGAVAIIRRRCAMILHPPHVVTMEKPVPEKDVVAVMWVL